MTNEEKEELLDMLTETQAKAEGLEDVVAAAKKALDFDLRGLAKSDQRNSVWRANMRAYLILNGAGR